VSVDKDKDGIYAGADVPLVVRDQDDSNPNIGAPVNTELGAGYAGQYAKAEPYASVSSIGEANAEFADAFSTMFGAAAPKDFLSAYAKELIALQSSRTNKQIKGKGNNIVIQGVSAQERQDILNKYLKSYATALIGKANTGDATAAAALKKGNFGVSLTTLKNAYSENGLPVNENSLLQQAANVTLNPDKLKSELNLVNLQAKTFFPALADKIDKGYTVKQLLSPYLQTRANILEEDADAIDLKELQSVAKDPKNLMNLYDYEVSLRNNPKWRFTKNAQDTMSNLANSLAKTFGLVG
jgi:hypothetical protein